MSILCHVHVINIITYYNHVTYYDMYTTLTLICLQHCSHYGAATHGSPQDNLIFLKCSQFLGVPLRGIELLLTLATVQFSLLVVQG